MYGIRCHTGNTMIKTVRIQDINEISPIIFGQEYDNSISRNRSSCLYRGLPNEGFHLATGLQRNCGKKKRELEKSILRNFTKYAAIEDPQLGQSVWRQLTIGQHHGLPTRLMDWTYSPLVGMHFATSGEDLGSMDQHDAVLWKIDINEIDSLLPEEYQKKLQQESAYLFTIDMLDHTVRDLAQYDGDMGDHGFVLLEPPSIDQRIINQYSYFSIIPDGMEDIERFLNNHTSCTVKYVIDKSLKWRIRDMLDQMNVNERTVYPGLDGLSAWIKRHYYVK